MLFQLPQSANTQILKDNGIYVDELKRVDQAKLEQWMFRGNTEIGELNIPNAFTHSGLTPSMLLKWIANYGLALADVDAEEYKDITDELDRRISVMKAAHSDRLFARSQHNWSIFPVTQLCNPVLTFKFDLNTETKQWTMTVRDELTSSVKTINVHEY